MAPPLCLKMFSTSFRLSLCTLSVLFSRAGYRVPAQRFAQLGGPLKSFWSSPSNNPSPTSSCLFLPCLPLPLLCPPFIVNHNLFHCLSFSLGGPHSSMFLPESPLCSSCYTLDLNYLHPYLPYFCNVLSVPCPMMRHTLCPLSTFYCYLQSAKLI